MNLLFPKRREEGIDRVSSTTKWQVGGGKKGEKKRGRKNFIKIISPQDGGKREKEGGGGGKGEEHGFFPSTPSINLLKKKFERGEGRAATTAIWQAAREEEGGERKIPIRDAFFLVPEGHSAD